MGFNVQSWSVEICIYPVIGKEGAFSAMVSICPFQYGGKEQLRVFQPERNLSVALEMTLLSCSILGVM